MEGQEQRLPYRSGVNKSLYVSKQADKILVQLERLTRRSESAIVSLLVEKYGPALVKSPKELNV